MQEISFQTSQQYCKISNSKNKIIFKNKDNVYIKTSKSAFELLYVLIKKIICFFQIRPSFSMKISKYSNPLKTKVKQCITCK